MILFKLLVQFNDRYDTFDFKSDMSVNDIKRIVGTEFFLNVDTFDIEVHDEKFNGAIKLDDKYIQDLQKKSSHTSNNMLQGDIVFRHISSGKNDTETLEDDFISTPTCEENLFDDRLCMPEEVSLIYRPEYECDTFESIIATTSTKACTKNVSSHQLESFRSPLNSVRKLNDQISTISHSSYDPIGKYICNALPQITEENLEQLSGTNKTILDLRENRKGVISAAICEILNGAAPESEKFGVDSEDELCQQRNESNRYVLASPLSSNQTQRAEVSSPIKFVHDVHPYQKTQHDMDLFLKYETQCRPHYVMGIQGSKTVAEKGKSILPRIQIPSRYRLLNRKQRQQFYLMIAIVEEEKVNDKRLLYLCDELLLLSDHRDKVSDGRNPVKLPFDSLPIEEDGTFLLILRLVNKSPTFERQQSRKSLFCQLDENFAKNLHSSEYDPKYIRLACTFVKHKRVIWNTLCISDYIRPKEHTFT